MDGDLESGTRHRIWLLVPWLVFAWVTLVIGTAANTGLLSSDAGKPTYFDLFFSDPIHFKVWFGSAAALLAVVQVITASWIYGRIPWARPPWLGAAHRWSGRAAFALTLPVAYHCIFLLGFKDTNGRALAHSFAGLFLYGALAAKVVVVRSRTLPGWLLPVLGGLVFAILIAVWYTSSLWFFRTVDVGL